MTSPKNAPSLERNVSELPNTLHLDLESTHTTSTSSPEIPTLSSTRNQAAPVEVACAQLLLS